MKRLKSIRNRETGASLVEFAMIMPLLLLLVLGIIEFSFLFGQFNDVRHGAREGARVAAVNTGDNATLHTLTCNAMDLSSPVTVQFSEGAGGGMAGTTGSVTVIASPTGLTGFPLLTSMLPSTLTSSIDFRIEQDADQWDTDGAAITCP